MKIFLYVLLVLTLWLSAEAATTLSPQARAQEIARLEKEKSELFQQLNAAIDDSVRSLRANNDSEAAMGITYIEDLREKMKALNASPSQLTSERVQTQGAEIVDPEEDFRRKSRGKAKATADALRQIQVPAMKQSDIKFFDAKTVFGDKARNPKRWQERHDNRVLMQQKLELWLEQREKERREIKRVIKAAREKDERCPRFGHLKTKRRKKKKGSRRDGEDGGEGEGGADGADGEDGGAGHLAGQDKKGVPGGGGDKYPCCRKCCKKSYLGCL